MIWYLFLYSKCWVFVPFSTSSLKIPDDFFLLNYIRRYLLLAVLVPHISFHYDQFEDVDVMAIIDIVLSSSSSLLVNDI